MPPALPPCDPPTPITLDADGNLPCPAGRPTRTWVLTLVGAAAIVVVGAAVAGSWGAVKFGLGAVATAHADENRALVATDATMTARIKAIEDTQGEMKQDIGQARRDVGDIRAALYDYMVDIDADKKVTARLAPRDGGAR